MKYESKGTTSPLRALIGLVRHRMDVERYLDEARGPGWSAELDEA